MCSLHAPCRLVVLAAVLAVPGALAKAEEAAAPPDFGRDVRPILAEHCWSCHSGDEPQGDLRLNERDSALAVITPGEPDASELVRRIESEDLAERMPPEGEPPLSADAIRTLRAWIAAGAPWATHWAFAPLANVTPPTVADRSWIRGDIDAFVLARLEAEQIAPSPEADRYTLIKRLYYDLVGLPPSVEEVDAFVADAVPDAYERLVDRLLASPHFGERWGRHWLDLAHYADSDGYEKDGARPDAYLFRDWVIAAHNADMPFDQFTIEQIAGDLLPGATARQHLATAFLRQTLTNEEGGVDQEEYRIYAVFDRAETVGTVWLGLTVNCVRCHTHKYDPIKHDEYYQFFAFFNDADEVTRELPVDAEQLDLLEQRLQPLQEALLARYRELAPLAHEWQQTLHRQILDYAQGVEGVVAPEIADKTIAGYLEMYPEKRTYVQREALFRYYVREVAQDAECLTLEQQIAALYKEYSARTMPVRIISEPRMPRSTHVFYRGDFLSPTDAVEPGVPALFAEHAPLDTSGDEPARLRLARWLVSSDNFLTPRVVVNRIWQRLFGAGLVRTPNDFGTRGELPTHPELLDWLARRFQHDLAWSRKALIREIVLSAAYRQASHARPELDERDPLNTLIARQNRFRVEGEIVRDLHLAASGLLTGRIGGPSVFPPMPEDLAKLSYANNFSWKDSEGADRYRRGMYTFFKRTVPHPNLMTFDVPDANVACVQRTISNTPLQALMLLNNTAHHEAAQALGAQLAAQPIGDTERLTRLLRRCIARPPADREVAALARVLDGARQYCAQHPGDAAELLGRAASSGVANDEAAAWTAVARVALNLDEFLTRE